MEQSLNFDNVAILQKECVVNSRSEVVIESEIIEGVVRPIPLIAANMSTVVNADFINKLWDLGAFGIMHRAGTKEEILGEVRKIKDHGCEWVGASVGVGSDQFHFAIDLVKNGANIINIDVAHGFSKRVIELAGLIKSWFQKSNIKVIVGNTINKDINRLIIEQEARLCHKVVDGLKIGIGGGLGCSTAITAGCTKNQWSAVYDFRSSANTLKCYPSLISDGNTRKPSDFVKAIGAGASCVMAGSIFARCPESAAPTIEVNGIMKKVYQGMASTAVQEKWRGKVNNNCAEGKTVLLDLGEPLEALLNRYAGALRSGISYAGFKHIDNFKQNCEFIRI
jgi:IMP dehydrogenase/GMP reductase